MMITPTSMAGRLLSNSVKLSLILSSIFIIHPSHADLVLTAPPRESPEAGQAVYEPLAAFLSSILGETVVYEHPLSWKRYEKKMKNDEYDIIFDGPHFAAWRIDTLLAEPLIKLPGSLRFVLVVNKSRSELTQLRHLIGREICTLSAPNLGALTLFSMYPHPARQPKFKIVNGGFREVAKAFGRGECEAAILRSSFYYNKTDPIFRDITKVLKRSKGLTNQGITVSRRIDSKTRKKLINSLTQGEGIVALKPILKRFYNKANRFEPSTSNDYVNHNLLRDNVIFGW